MMDLNSSFQEHSLAWLLVSSIIGGVIGATLKFIFQEVFSYRLGWRRRTVRIVRKYTTPLVRSAEALERRINIYIRNPGSRWFTDDEYFRLSTLYAFGEYLGWIRILERRFGFLPFESSKRGSQFRLRLYGVFRALSSASYFRASNDANEDESAIPRLMLTAVGEAMTRTRGAGGVLEFREFVLAYGRKAQFRRWFAELDSFLRHSGEGNRRRADRLIIAAANLRALIRFLDPKGRLVDLRQIVNHDRIENEDARAQLLQELEPLFAAVRSARRHETARPAAAER
jgi:hypothetical protein